MPVTTVFRAAAILVVFLHLSCSSSLPARNKRHVDGMFTSEFSRARGSAAIRKLINSAMAGKRDVEESGYRTDAIYSGPQVDSTRKELPGLAYIAMPELRSDDQALNDLTENQLCSAILNLLSRTSLQSQQMRNSQDY
ncbi:secretin [Hyperolius riggenbachi]|uniref:secretin n=1 Tax=Hyperolius riggenbachi TaxID=752182 RepID=UPI0035A31FF2